MGRKRRLRKDNLIFAGKVAEILGIDRRQAWRLLRTGVIQNAIQRENGLWEAPRSSVEALKRERERSGDGRVKKARLD